MSDKTSVLETSGRTPLLCDISWREGENDQAEAIFRQVRRSNLLQSLTYGKVMAKLNYQRLIRGVITMEGREAGMIQVLEAGLFGNAIHAALIDRGPLWLDPYGTPEHIAAFTNVLRTAYPKRPGRRIRFIPECADTPRNRETLEKQGFRKKSEPYHTLWWNILRSNEELRSGLKKSWRGSLVKAERSNVCVSWDEKGESLLRFVEHYKEDRQKRNYNGPKPYVLLSLAQAFLHRKNALIGCASLDGKPLAGVLIFCHGKSATYQAGWTTRSGRESCAHHLLLWNAALKLKERDINEIDLGGVEPEQGSGIRTFKQGTGGTPVRTPGLWI